MASTARLDELKKKFDENPRRYFAPLANEHRKSGDLDQAIALCRAHLPQQPAHISGHIVLGQALYEAGQLDESRETFQTALELDPENLIALRYLGDIARDGGDLHTARSWYHRVLEVDPRNEEIVQLVRDLDGPPAAARPEAVAAEPGSAPESEEVVERVAKQPSATAPKVPDDSRFAPLTLDQLADSEMFAPTGDATSSASPDASAGSFDTGAGWTTDSPTAEMPLLDVSEIDPFDMSPAASAASLFDGGGASSAAAGEHLLDDLAAAHEPVDIGELEAAPAEAPGAWAPEASATPDAPAAPDAPAVSSELSAPEFDEGAFYLDPAPPAPADWSRPEIAADAAAESAGESVEAGSSDDATPGYEAESWVEAAAPPVEVPNAADSDGDVVATDTATAAPEQPSVAYHAPQEPSQSLESLAVPPVDEAASSVDDGLGLEVMEFVPPTASSERSVPASPVNADPLVGHMPELTAGPTGPTPDAFVTETMAELYLQQGFRTEALAVYRELLARNPADTSLRERIDQIESGSMSSLGMATLSENVVESARKRQTERPTRSVRSFFASMAARRAPYPQPRDDDATSYDEAAADEPGTPEVSAEAEVTGWELEPEPQAAASTEAPPLHGSADDETKATLPEAPQSASEQMAAFDPFADAWGAAPPSASSAPNDAATWGATDESSQSEPPAAYGDSAIDAVAPSTPASAPHAPEAPRPTPRSLEDLFPESVATPRADAAAQTLATAFGRTEPQGRPTRAASNELSLDRVFRGAPPPEASPGSDGGFSFDQFFSDARAAAGDGPSTNDPSSAPEGNRGEESGDTHDIEQFTAWLEGLKKK